MDMIYERNEKIMISFEEFLEIQHDKIDTHNLFNIMSDEIFFVVTKFHNIDEHSNMELAANILKLKNGDDTYSIGIYTKNEIEKRHRGNNEKYQQITFLEIVHILEERDDIINIVINPNRDGLIIDRKMIWEYYFLNEVENSKGTLKNYYEDPENYNELLEELYYKSLVYLADIYKKEKFRIAHEYILFMLEYFKGHASEIFYYCGVIFEKTGNIQNAENCYRQCVNMEKHNYWLYFQLSNFYRRIGKCVQEREVYNDALKLYECSSDINDMYDAQILLIMERTLELDISAGDKFKYIVHKANFKYYKKRMYNNKQKHKVPEYSKYTMLGEL